MAEGTNRGTFILVFAAEPYAEEADAANDHKSSFCVFEKIGYFKNKS